MRGKSLPSRPWCFRDVADRNSGFHRPRRAGDAAFHPSTDPVEGAAVMDGVVAGTCAARSAVATRNDILFGLFPHPDRRAREKKEGMDGIKADPTSFRALRFISPF
jgi:hypothetical protein